ncbi:tetratricopeptide repeat protein [Sphingomonas canadensis]|uniref:Tetratricopeptide repeat protein n=1 Tax=Sphingomonas canadensis TaxID=1219257 RepID=A0ABW3H1Q9_9SPHN|nr:tetratricopeptide repeat protein [Sphingomonas canadensis]MCW3834702.1 tetratricopeptide repeat protein [Sphingomonas canadensis]
MMLWLGWLGREARVPPAPAAPSGDWPGGGGGGAGDGGRLFAIAMGRGPAGRSRAARRSAAADLVLAGAFARGREAWLAIARDYPGDLADALGHIGASYHLERDYPLALEYYRSAIRVGADPAALAAMIAGASKGLAALG